MRTVSLLLLSLASASSLVAAKPAEGGSIEALLDRVAQRSNRSVSAKPSETPVAVKDDVKKAPAGKKADLSVEGDDGRESPLLSCRQHFTCAELRRLATAGNKLVKRSRAQKHEKMAKRWVWATAIIQDGATDAPPVGQNADLLTPSTTIAIDTPAASLAQPTFAPVAATTGAASQIANTLVASAAVNSTSTTTPAPKTSMTPGVRKFGHKAVGRAHHGNPENRRWVWATSIIQDGATGAPPPGQNANLLSSSAHPVTTPAAALTPPSFPPIAASSSSTTTPPAASISVPAPAIAVAAASTTLAAPLAATTTSSPHGLKQIFEEIESGFERLFHIHQSTTTAAPAQTTSAAPNAKRWVWATSIIQDGDTSAPPAGSNYNLLSGTTPANTPAATLVPPSFPPVRSPSPSSSTSSPTVTKTPVLAASAVSQSSGSHRILFKDRHDAAPSSPPPVVAAANAAVTHSILSAATKPTTAAQQWYRADPKKRRMARAKRA